MCEAVAGMAWLTILYKHFFLSRKKFKNNYKRAGKLAQSVKVSAAKPVDLSSIPEIPMMARKN